MGSSNPGKEIVMKREPASTAQPAAIPKFEPPRLKALGSLAALTKAFNPGSNTDFTFSSF
jgi:hypothetical protein